MSETQLPLDVIAAHFSLLDPDRQRDTAYLCLLTTVERTLALDPNDVAASVFDHLRQAIGAFEEGLYRQTMRQLVMGQEIEERITAGAAFEPIGFKHSYRLMMLRRRMDLIRLLGPGPQPALAC